MKHTPGPWRKSNDELGYGEFDILADNGLGYPNIGIATVVDARFSDPELGTVALHRDICQANAELIARAPELQETAIRLLGLLRRALLLLRDEVDPNADFDGWLAHMGHIGYPEFESELIEELK